MVHELSPLLYKVILIEEQYKLFYHSPFFDSIRDRNRGLCLFFGFPTNAFREAFSVNVIKIFCKEVSVIWFGLFVKYEGNYTINGLSRLMECNWDLFFLRVSWGFIELLVAASLSQNILHGPSIKILKIRNL